MSRRDNCAVVRKQQICGSISTIASSDDDNHHFNQQLLDSNKGAAATSIAPPAPPPLNNPPSVSRGARIFSLNEMKIATTKNYLNNRRN